jgi:ABC-type transport system substrate-binding protein
VNYWDRMQSARITRRGVLAASGAAALGSSFLAACSGGGETKVEDVNTLVTKPADTSKQAKKGGTLNHYRNAGTDNMDPYASLSNITSSISGMVYSRLTILEAGYNQESAGNIVGDIAESWEWSPDRLTLTMKLRPGTKFHNLAPVNGRAIDIDDVMLSWQRFAQRGLLRSELVNSVNPNAPVTSFTSTDSRTVVFKLSSPVAHLTTLLATPNSGNPHIAPKEADGGFDLRQRMIGSGPWQFENYEPSVGWKFKRFADYYLERGERPYIDNINVPIIPEYSSGLAQFKAGNLHYFAVLPQDILTMKNEEPRLAVYQTLYNSTPFRTIFGWNPTPANRTPFRDERVRQAYSMTLDRDLITDVIYNVDQFRKSGLPVETRWNGEMQANWYAGWWLDPKGKDFGPNAKYLQKDVAEAKKLMAAAGLADGVEVLNTYWTSGEGGPDFPKNVEILCDMAREAGFKFQTNILPFAGEYASRYRDSKGRFEGISYKFGPSGGGQDAIGQMTYFNHSTGGGYGGFDPKGVGDFSGDPYIDEQLNKAKGEVDVEKRKAIAFDIQRYSAKAAYQPRWPAAATGFEMTWPALRNYRVWDRDPRPNYHFWLDETQPPEKK